jgi:acylphosphatase
VFFRASTQEQAEQRGITGYARNLSDRRVEVLAYGAERAVDDLKAWLWEGPRHSEVTDVQCEAVDIGSPPTTFTTK